MTSSTSEAPMIQLRSLDELWFQVAGTVCNLTCHHCFISCSPQNHSFEFLTFEEVEAALRDSVRLGVREYYFTGGEPFLNKELRRMLARTLELGPATVLTNATVLKPEWLSELYAAEQSSRYSLEFRVSIDGPSPLINDPIRGAGTFVRAMQGVRLLCEAGFLPIITMTQTWDDADSEAILEEFRRVLAGHGCSRPRLKILPRLKLGAEEQRTEGYADTERITSEMMQDFDTDQLLCHHSRVVTNRGVYVCPILLESPDARLGDTLSESLQPFAMKHGACYTCYQFGAICSNTTLTTNRKSGTNSTPGMNAASGSTQPEAAS